MALTVDAPSVQTYLTLIQGVISRMANNSASCKTWCVTIVAAVLALAIDKGSVESIFVGLLPLVLFLFLDAYYLSLEHDYRNIYNNFVEKLIGEKAEEAMLFKLKPENNYLAQRLGATFKQISSLSIWPFYLLILASLSITYFVAKPAAEAGAGSCAPPGPSPTVSSTIQNSNQ